MQAAEPLTEEMVAGNLVCGDDIDEHLRAIQAFADAGYDELFINQIGPDQERFFDFYAGQVLPALREGTKHAKGNDHR